MKLTIEKLKHLEPQYKTSISLCLDNQNLREIDIIAQECEQLQYLSTRFNLIQSVKPLQQLTNLWVIDLQQNQIINFESLSIFKVLGYLSLTINNTNQNSLRSLKNLDHYKKEINQSKLYLVSFLKILISIQEYGLLIINMSLQKKGNQLSPRNSQDLQKLKTGLNLMEIVFKKYIQMKEYMNSLKILAKINTFKSIMNVLKRYLLIVVSFMTLKRKNYCSELEMLSTQTQIFMNFQKHLFRNAYKSPILKQFGIKFPSFQLQKWLNLNNTNKLLLVVFLHCYLEGLIPQQILTQIIDLIFNGTKQARSSQEAHILVQQFAPFQQMGLMIFLRQDLINNLNEDDRFPYSNLYYSNQSINKSQQDSERINSEKMIQIIECLNINNLIFKFQEVQENIQMTDTLVNNDKNQKLNNVIGFPEIELEQDQQVEVLIILKERRRAICEFILKILNSFKLLDAYFIEGSFNNLRNILTVIEGSQDHKNKLNFLQKFTFIANNSNSQEVASQQSSNKQQSNVNSFLQNENTKKKFCLQLQNKINKIDILQQKQLNIGITNINVKQLITTDRAYLTNQPKTIGFTRSNKYLDRLSGYNTQQEKNTKFIKVPTAETYLNSASQLQNSQPKRTIQQDRFNSDIFNLGIYSKNVIQELTENSSNSKSPHKKIVYNNIYPELGSDTTRNRLMRKSDSTINCSDQEQSYGQPLITTARNQQMQPRFRKSSQKFKNSLGFNSGKPIIVLNQANNTQNPKIYKEVELKIEESQQIFPSLKKSYSHAQVETVTENKGEQNLMIYSDQRKIPQTAIKNQKSFADLHQNSQAFLKTTPEFLIQNEDSLKLACVSSYPSQNLSRSSSSYILVPCKKKKGIPRTREMWRAIHRTQDIVKCFTNTEHQKRILTHENTPWIQHSLLPKFEKRKDPFVEKYQILLIHAQKEKAMQEKSEKLKQKVLQQSALERQQIEEEVQQQQISESNNKTYEKKLKHHFDSYIKALTLSKQQFHLDLQLSQEEKRRMNHYELEEKYITTTEDKSIKTITNSRENDNDNPYFITQQSENL